jgi:hypothetical protein
MLSILRLRLVCLQCGPTLQVLSYFSRVLFVVAFDFFVEMLVAFVNVADVFIVRCVVFLFLAFPVPFLSFFDPPLQFVRESLCTESFPFRMVHGGLEWIVGRRRRQRHVHTHIPSVSGRQTPQTAFVIAMLPLWIVVIVDVKALAFRRGGLGFRPAYRVHRLFRNRRDALRLGNSVRSQMLSFRLDSLLIELPCLVHSLFQLTETLVPAGRGSRGSVCFRWREWRGLPGRHDIVCLRSGVRLTVRLHTDGCKDG